MASKYFSQHAPRRSDWQAPLAIGSGQTRPIFGKESLERSNQSTSEAGTAATQVLHKSLKSETKSISMNNNLDGEDFTNSIAPSPINPYAVWQIALSHLEMSLPPSTFNTWVRDTQVVAYEDGEFVICTTNSYARDWLQNRLRPMIKRQLSQIIGRSVQVTFQVAPRPVVDAPGAHPAPLYETMPENNGSAYTVDQDLARAASPQPAAAISPIPQTAAVTASNGASGRQPYSKTCLNSAYTFDTLVVGNHNRLAAAAAQSVTEKPGRSFNPLFIYGGVGLGKTHLLHAIGNRLHQRGYKTLYCTTEQFTNELITAIRSQTTEEFRNKYRELDLLLIDDIQFISGKDSTQEEFFHTFNHLHAAGRQVVVSSDRLPKAVHTLEQRLRSRFEGGLQVDISQPDFETRVAILEAKARERQLLFSRDILKEIASRVESNVRELEGALNQLTLQSELHDGSLDLAATRHILDNLAPERTPCSPTEVIGIVAQYYGLSSSELTGDRRLKEIAHARHVAMHLLRTLNALSLPQIGCFFGNRDHTTVSHGIEKIEKLAKRDESLRRDLTTLREKVFAPIAA